MSLPYNWTAVGVVRRPTVEVGDLIPYEHRVYRVLGTRARDDGRVVAHVRPVGSTSAMTVSSDDLHLLAPVNGQWTVYPNGHYPICAECKEPLPCRHATAFRIARIETQRLTRFEDPNVCPACMEPITARQQSHTFPDNLLIPGGAPVTFHTRRGCRAGLEQYERTWVSKDPEHRVAEYTCSGHVTRHGDGTYECTRKSACPGPQARHPAYSTCACRACHAQGGFDCHPTATDRNREAAA